jgi:hypothetical protein
MRWEAVLRGLFAGNIFDLGCAATTAAYHEVRCCWVSWACWPAGLETSAACHKASPATLLLAACVPHMQGGIEFHATRDKLVERPWVIDDLDALLDRLCR